MEISIQQARIGSKIYVLPAYIEAILLLKILQPHHSFELPDIIPQQPTMCVQIQEARIVLAIEKNFEKLSRRATAKIHNVLEAKLSDRMNGRINRKET